MTTDWQPSASLDIIRQRAGLYKTIRRFMEERDIMEVQTPVLSHFGNTDPNLESFRTLFHPPSEPVPVRYFLNTSPEFAMNRLIAAGSGSIYQICKVFRDKEIGPNHQPEFT
ncbi:MAG: elongation factor P lysine(34) lysyltransferase, partial [Gammaproteobacteria bacterium]|nr:elongation factor P lysine(34) lysyltransferase [Gammaproteobacteria bacterium]